MFTSATSSSGITQESDISAYFESHKTTLTRDQQEKIREVISSNRPSPFWSRHHIKIRNFTFLGGFLGSAMLWGPEAADLIINGFPGFKVVVISIFAVGTLLNVGAGIAQCCYSIREDKENARLEAINQQKTEEIIKQASYQETLRALQDFFKTRRQEDLKVCLRCLEEINPQEKRQMKPMFIPALIPMVGDNERLLQMLQGLTQQGEPHKFAGEKMTLSGALETERIQKQPVASWRELEQELGIPLEELTIDGQTLQRQSEDVRLEMEEGVFEIDSLDLDEAGLQPAWWQRLTFWK